MALRPDWKIPANSLEGRLDEQIQASLQIIQLLTEIRDGIQSLNKLNLPAEPKVELKPVEKLVDRIKTRR